MDRLMLELFRCRSADCREPGCAGGGANGEDECCVDDLLVSGGTSVSKVGSPLWEYCGPDDVLVFVRRG